MCVQRGQRCPKQTILRVCNSFPRVLTKCLSCAYTHACYKRRGGSPRIQAGSGSRPCGPGRGTPRSGRTPGTGRPPGSCPGGRPRCLGIRHAGNILSGPQLGKESVVMSCFMTNAFSGWKIVQEKAKTLCLKVTLS